MAYLQQNNQNDPNNQSGGTSLTSGGSSFTGGGGQQAQGANGGGNQFSNLQRLMNLNQNAPNTAAKVGQNVQQGQQAVQTNVDKTNQGIGQAFNYDQNDMNNRVQSNDFTGLQNELNTKYQGPQAGSINVGPKNLNQIGQQTNALGSQAGQQQLLKQQYGRSDYTGGQQKLDAFLQSRNQNFQQQAAQARNQGKQLQQNAANQNQGLNLKAAATEQQTQQGVQNLKQGLGNTVQSYQTEAEKAADAANKQNQDLQSQVAAKRAALANGQSDADTLKNLGFDPNGYTYGADLSQFVNFKGGPANVNNIMSQDTANKFTNINKMLGNDTTGFDPSQAGTYQQGQINYDKEGLQKAIADQQAKYNQGMAPQLQHYQNALQVQQLADQRDKTAYKSPEWQALQDQIQQLAPGAVTNGFTRADWAADNRNKAWDDYQGIKNQLDSQYLKKIGVS